MEGKLTVFVSTFVILSFILMRIDGYLGIQFMDIGTISEGIHKLMYMAYGAVLARMIAWVLK